MNAAQSITRTLRRREQYRSALAVFRAVLLTVKFLTVAGAIYLFAVLCLSY